MLKVKGDLQNPLLTLLLNHCPTFLRISTKQQGERFSLGLKKAAQRTLFWTFQVQCFLGWRLAPEMLRHPGDESVLESGAAHGSQRPAACPLPDPQMGGREGRQATDSTGLRRCLLLSWTPQHSPMMLGLGAKLRSRVQTPAVLLQGLLLDLQAGATEAASTAHRGCVSFHVSRPSVTFTTQSEEEKEKGHREARRHEGATETPGWDSPAAIGREQTGS